jgi:Zinc carboxypeptidase
MTSPSAAVTAAISLGLILSGVVYAAPGTAQSEATSAVAAAPDTSPWDGNPISAGLGPTYGEQWCSPVGNENVPQSDPLALIPYGAIGCTLDQFGAEAAAAGVPDRLDYDVIGHSVLGRDMYGVVVNALETPEQQRDYARWQQLRQIMLTDPAQAQSLLASWGEDVKLPMFIEANIHGGEREGTDAMMQAVRDLVTLPRGTSDVVDEILDHAIVVIIPTQNPDGRAAGRRSNENRFDMNRDFMVQSQPETQASIAFQHEWLSPVGLFMHGYYNPTLIEGLTKPHNPGFEYDKFLYWNQRRLDANQAALGAIGRDIQRPVNQWDKRGVSGTRNGNPAIAEGWDDWGPIYTPSMATFWGVDNSTVEMCDDAKCGGRLGSKREQYLVFYSSAKFWVEHRSSILNDQLEIFRRGVTGAARVNCCDDPLIASRGFTEDQHNWMVDYPEAFLIPFVGGSADQVSPNRGVQRSDAEANRMAQWLLDNGIEVERTDADLTWNGHTYPSGTYVVSMQQALRGLAYTSLSAGQDISDRIGQLYAPPGAWSHGSLWGADVVEVPADDPSFDPSTVPVSQVNELQGGVRTGGPADWYAVTIKGVREARAVLGLLRGGVDGEVAEQSFASASAGQMPAGSLVFDASTAAALAAAGKSAGMYFERGVGPKPTGTQLDEAPKVAVLVDSSSPVESDQSFALRRIFGPDVGFVSTAAGSGSLQNAADDPLASYDVIYNTGVAYPLGRDATARARLQAFFQRGGGYIGSGQSANNFAFLSKAQPSLVQGNLVRDADEASGGIAEWSNVASDGPITGGYPATDTLLVLSDVTWFSTLPTGAVVDARYLPSTTDMFVAGLWRDRDPRAASAPIVVHGTTLVGSRYLGLATDPFSRGDAEREWPLVAQGAMWANLTDE